jgi:hypothetical protein
MNLSSRITILETESLFEFFLPIINDQLPADKALELIENLCHDHDHLCWAFRRDGEVVTIYRPPEPDIIVTIRDEFYVVVPEVQPQAILGWLPPPISASFTSDSTNIPIHILHPTPTTITLRDFLLSPGIMK